MANSKGSSNVRNMYSGKNALLPPKSPFPIISPSYADYVPSLPIGFKPIQKPREGNTQHQRTSSESFLIEEQPSWLDDLLNEPETPVRKGGHRRSSSDSFAYVDAINASSLDYAAQDEYRNRNISWSQEFDRYKDASFYGEANSVKPKNRPWDLPMNARSHTSKLPYVKDSMIPQSTRALATPQEVHGASSIVSEKLERYEPNSHDAKALSEKKDGSYTKSPASDPDTKRAKQQFAQRSRVRKLQYIAELERNVQALQAEGSEVSAELEFLNQQNLILSMENKALKQRLESLAQEQIIKYLEQEVLEREIGRLRTLYQQQQQPQQQPSSSHQRSSSRDLDSQFANLSFKHKEAISTHDPVSGPLLI